MKQSKMYVFYGKCLLVSMIFISFTSHSQTNQNLPSSSNILKYFNADFNGLSLRSTEPISDIVALESISKSFIFNSVMGNFNNYPGHFDVKLGEKSDHIFHQRFFLKNFNDTLMIDVDIEFPYIGGEGLLLEKKAYPTGLFLRDGTVDLPNVSSATVSSSSCTLDYTPKPSISVKIYGKRVIDGDFGLKKYWQTVVSVPHNDQGTIEIEEINVINKTIKGNFRSTISSLYVNKTQDELQKIDDWMCKPELYKVEKSEIKGEFYVNFKEY